MAGTPVQTTADGSVRKNKRPRAIQACEFCRAKKYKCSGTWPCQHCEKYRNTCVFEAAETNAAGLYPASYVRALEERIEKLNAAAALTQFTPSSTSMGLSYHGDGYLGRSRQATDSTPMTERVGTGSYVDVGQQARELSDETATEIADVNRHTQGLEFHGSTSSLGFLGSIQQRVRAGRNAEPTSTPHTTSLVDALHNTGFSPQDNLPQPNNSRLSSELDNAFFSPRASVFLDTYFTNLHFVHPMIDREEVYRKSEGLWRGSIDHQNNSFVNLYLALISLGALIKTWNEDNVMGMHRFDWSRSAFRRAASNLQRLGTRNDIETIQAYFIMAKICQNELNPSLAYIYLGSAIRLALSAGINRETRRPRGSKISPSTASRTWWGIYSHEIELSFSLGRPDTLGYDLYHNVPQPLVDDSETAVIPVMVDFARIIRTVSLEIYLGHKSPNEKLARAFQIENDMILWCDRLPPKIKPRFTQNQHRNNTLRDPLYARLQRLVLQIRFYNVTMLAMRPFLISSSQPDHLDLENLPLAVSKCITAAAHTIEIVHDTYLTQMYFRTWWYNTTYTLFAASIILFALTQPPMHDWPLTTLNELIERSIEVLEAMTECVVAQKAAEMIRATLAQIRGGHQSHAAIEYIAKSLPVSPRLSAENGVYDFTDDFSLLLGNNGEFDFNYDLTGYGAPSNMMFWPSLGNGTGQI